MRCHNRVGHDRGRYAQNVLPVVRLCESLGFDHRRLESIPGNDGFDGGEGIGAGGAASINAWPIRAYSRTLSLMTFPLSVKLLCMGPFALLKESADQSLEHVERLIDQSCRELQHHGGECCLTAKRFELGQVLDGRLATFAGELQPMILMDARGALRFNADRADNP